MTSLRYLTGAKAVALFTAWLICCIAGGQGAHTADAQPAESVGPGMVLAAVPAARAESDPPGSEAGTGTQVIRVGVYENAPKVFTTGAGRPAGIFIDVLEEVAKNEKWQIQYIPGTWAEGLDRLARRQIDLMPDVALTAEREEQYSFHQVPVLSSWSQVYARKGSNIQSILDLNGKRIAVLEGSVQQRTFDQLSLSFWLDVILLPVPDNAAMFAKVSHGEADAAITNRFYGMMQALQL